MKLNLEEAFARIAEPWSPRIAGRIAGCEVKLARLRGAFVWHAHAATEELFLVISGRLWMRFRDREDVELGAGEMLIVPRGVEHCPETITEEVEVLLFEAAGTENTGGVESELRNAARELEPPAP